MTWGEADTPWQVEEQSVESGDGVGIGQSWDTGTLTVKPLGRGGEWWKQDPKKSNGS